MKRTIPFLLYLLAAGAWAAPPTDTAPVFPLLGLWRVVSVEANGKDVSPAEGGMELDFQPGGHLIITGQDPARGITKPLRMRWRYTFVHPNVVTYTLDGSTYERQRFTLSGTQLILEHLDYNNKAKLRRIPKTEFTETPTDTQQFPK